MRKLILMLFCLSAVFASAQTTDDLLHQGQARRQAKKVSELKLDKQNYWIGKVPVVDGLATFQKTIVCPGKSQAQLMESMTAVVENIIAASKLENASSLVPQDAAQGQVIATVGELMYFKNKAWEADFTKFYYQLTANCTDGKVTLTINHLQYRYEEGREEGGNYLKAEGWITDDGVFNNSKTKFLKEPAKFRRATIDRANAIFKLAQDAVK